MAGVKGRSGGRREGAGAKGLHQREELSRALSVAMPETTRHNILAKVAEMAELGDMNAAKLALSYAFGTPRSGDEMKIEEEVDKAIDSTLTIIEKKVSPEAWAEVEAALGI